MCVLSHSVVFSSLQSHGLQPARLLGPWGFSRQEYWSGLPYPPFRGASQLNPGLPHCRRILYHLSHQGSPVFPVYFRIKPNSWDIRAFMIWCYLLRFFQCSCMDVRVGLWRKLSTKELMLLKCGVGEDSWESLGLQGDPTSPFWRRSALGFLWKEWC